MDPDTRTLRVVDYEEDMKENADKLFTLLMGTEVEPRRRFIIDNAFMAEIDG